MKSLAAAVIAVALVPAAAHAGGYVGAGIGTSASVGADGARLTDDGSHTGRLVIGQRLSRVSIEGALSGYGLGTTTSRATFDGYSLGAAAVLHVPIVDRLEGDVRVGLERTWLSGKDAPDLSGDGWTGGLGLSYRLNLALTSASIWVDYSRHAATLGGSGNDIHTTFDMWTAGVSFGL